MVDQACTRLILPPQGLLKWQNIKSKKNKTGKQENLPELLDIGLMEWKVLLKSPETKADPPKGESEENQCGIQPHKRKGLGQGVSTKVNALKNCLQKTWGHRRAFLMPPCETGSRCRVERCVLIFSCQSTKTMPPGNVLEVESTGLTGRLDLGKWGEIMGHLEFFWAVMSVGCLLDPQWRCQASVWMCCSGVEQRGGWKAWDWGPLPWVHRRGAQMNWHPSTQWEGLGSRLNQILRW